MKHAHLKKSLLYMIKYHYKCILEAREIYEDILDWYIIYDYHKEKMDFFEQKLENLCYE